MGVLRRIRAWWRMLVKTVRVFFRGLRGLPLIGEIGGRFELEPAVIDDDVYGRSTELPTVLEIVVAEHERWPIRVGRLVDRVFFADYPPVIFNVCFSCSRPDGLGHSEYADPTSHWFNVFFGFYEIDVPIPAWERPFGFESSDRDALDVEFGDLTRIGKSDWNYFSNYVYGVPRDVVARHDRLDDPEVATRVSPQPVVVAGKTFIECEVDGLEVVSGYEATGGRQLENNVWFFSAVWRRVFGTAAGNPEYPTSFCGTRMKLRFLIRWERGFDVDLNCEAYKTFIYGGSINKGYEGPLDNERFLDLQMEAVKQAVFRKRSP